MSNISTNKVKQNVPEKTKLKYYTIETDTILYHGSKDISKFEASEINLGDINGITHITFFSTDKESMEIKIGKCQDNFNKKGWIHKFKVTNKIENILIIDENNKNFTNDDLKLTNEKCGISNNTRLNGFGYSTKKSNGKIISYFALCIPKDYLTYIGTYSCESSLKVLINFETEEVVNDTTNLPITNDPTGNPDNTDNTDNTNNTDNEVNEVNEVNEEEVVVNKNN